MGRKLDEGRIGPWVIVKIEAERRMAREPIRVVCPMCKPVASAFAVGEAPTRAERYSPVTMRAETTWTDRDRSGQQGSPPLFVGHCGECGAWLLG